MGTLNPPNAVPVQVRYVNTTQPSTGGVVKDLEVPVSHCHIIGERLFCCGLELFSHTFGGYTDEPRHPLCTGCGFVVESLNRGVQVGIKNG
jgi:hypothetical protein